MIKTKSDPPTLIISTQNICLKKESAGGGHHSHLTLLNVTPSAPRCEVADTAAVNSEKARMQI